MTQTSQTISEIKKYLPIELWSIILLFLNQNDIKKIILIGYYTKNNILIEYGLQTYKNNLRNNSELLYAIFDIFLNIKQINTKLDYINKKSYIYNLNIGIKNKQKSICLNALDHIIKFIKNEKDKAKFINICKHIGAYYKNNVCQDLDSNLPFNFKDYFMTRKQTIEFF